jgi:hypothetical protein
MKLIPICKIIMTGAVFSLLLTGMGCGSYGGADVYLENISMGSLSMEGKPVTGLPTQKVNIVLKTGANKVLISQAGGKTTIKLQPSGAVITTSSDGLSFTGVEADQVEIKWTDNITK